MGWHLTHSAVVVLHSPQLFSKLAKMAPDKIFQKQGVLSVNHVKDDMVEVNGFEP